MKIAYNIIFISSFLVSNCFATSDCNRLSSKVFGKEYLQQQNTLPSQYNRNEYLSFFKNSYQFTKEYSINFTNFLLKSRIKDEKMSLVFILGGSEYLGLIVEKVLIKLKIYNIDIHYIYLTRNVMDENTDDEIYKYLKQLNIFKNENIIFIDSAFRGSIIKDIFELMDTYNITNQKQGKLFVSKTKDTDKIEGFNNYDFRINNKQINFEKHVLTYNWNAFLIDEGVDINNYSWTGGVDETVIAFQKSRPSVDKLIISNSIFLPNNKRYTGVETIKYKASMDGVDAAIKDLFEE